MLRIRFLPAIFFKFCLKFVNFLWELKKRKRGWFIWTHFITAKISTKLPLICVLRWRRHTWSWPLAESVGGYANIVRFDNNNPCLGRLKVFTRYLLNTLCSYDCYYVCFVECITIYACWRMTVSHIMSSVLTLNIRKGIGLYKMQLQQSSDAFLQNFGNYVLNQINLENRRKVAACFVVTVFELTK